VTGVIALMMQRRPRLDSGQIVAAIRATAIKDANTGPANWTPEYGHGKISAKALVEHVSPAVPAAVAAGRAPRRAAPIAAARGAVAPGTRRPGRKVAAKHARTAVRRAGKRARS
jgi:hypothetical protein